MRRGAMATMSVRLSWSVKLTVQLLPDLTKALHAYAALYEAAYGRAESVADLVPAMLASFLESDREFARARRQKPGP